MKIAVDGQLLLKGEKTGIGWCAENILKRMPEYQQDLILNCFTLGYHERQTQGITKYQALGYQIERCPWFHNALYRIISNLFPVPYSFFFRRKADVSIFFNYIVPPGVKGKKIVFVHDMAYKAYPETVRKRTRDMLNLSLEKSCKRADKIITISEFSKTEIMRYLGVKEDKIVIMPIGVDYARYHPNYPQDEVNAVKAKYHIEGEYLLYLGTLEPRKNITRLIQAYAQVRKNNLNAPKLVLAGRKGWMYDSIFESVKELQLEEDIVFTGYVGADEAPVLMKGAVAFLFPSLYEGFGMPPLEAMACGTPVIVSDAASLPEVVGDAGILVNPMSVQSISKGIDCLWKDTERREALSRKGVERAHAFSWDSAMEIMVKVVEELV